MPAHVVEQIAHDEYRGDEGGDEADDDIAHVAGAQNRPVLVEVEGEGARLVFLLRLSPLVPYVLLNYVLGVSRIGFRDYMVGWAGQVPLIAGYVYAGKAAGDLATLASGVGTTRGATYYWMLGLGLVSTALATALVTRAAARAIEGRELIAKSGSVEQPHQ